MSRWLALLPLAVCVALVALFIGWSLKRDPAYKPDAMVGQAIPETVLPLLGTETSPESFVDLKTVGHGDPMLINVFASWCAPCRIEHPQLIEAQRKGIKIVGIAYKDNPTATRAFLEELGDPFSTVLVDREGRAGLDLGISGVPETFAVNAYGTITAKHSGPLLTSKDVDTLVASLELNAH